MKELQGQTLNVVLVEWNEPGKEPVRYILPVEVFDSIAKQAGGMSVVLRDATPVKAKKSGNGGSSEIAKMREWLKANGHEVGDKGRILQELQDIYRAAHPQG